MKRVIFLFLLLSIFYQSNSQSRETSLYLREELVHHRDNLLKQAQEIQSKIDALDKKLGNETQSTNTVQFFTKTAKYKDGSYSRSVERKKQYKTKTTKTYYRGPRGGCYYINSNGNKTYVARSMCN
ncbi:hypothetical protein [Aquimarina pacifica]|uniref:hypothetical protein n=1 Tax=Aquimarina pacifica TaxID=1296415 RepID=UPI00046E58B9|nr:hypothetical protein [Aquimarina pacifica]